MTALVRAPVLANAGGDRVDVGRLVVIAADETQLRHPAPALQLRVTRSNTEAVVVPEYCGYSGSTMQSPRRRRRRSCSSAAGMDGRAVGHAQRDARRQIGAGARREPRPSRARAVQQQRRACRRPDLAIRVGAARRADAQNDAVQSASHHSQRGASTTRGSQRNSARNRRTAAGRRRVGSAEIHQQHAQARRRCRARKSGSPR